MNKKQSKIVRFLRDNPSYLKKGKKWLWENKFFASPFKDVEIALKEIKRINDIVDPSKFIKNLKNKKFIKVKDRKETKKVIEVVNKNKITEDIAEKLIEKVESKPKKEKIKFKRLFFDIETSPNVVFSWRIGYNLNIGHENILKERAIISIAWKFSGDNKVQALHWDNGDDKQMLIDFIKILNTADEIVSHNGDKFDIKWLRTRCIYHNIDMFPDYTSVDTLKVAKAGFLFNNNKLDYIGDYLGVGKKMSTGGFSLWKSIVLDNDPKAMDKMIKYNKVDVIRLEQIYDKLNPYSKHKTHVGVLTGNSKCSCPNCGSLKIHSNGKIVSAAGIMKYRMRCSECGKYFRISKTDFENRSL